jgi:hypothetical protein
VSIFIDAIFAARERITACGFSIVVEARWLARCARFASDVREIASSSANGAQSASQSAENVRGRCGEC